MLHNSEHIVVRYILLLNLFIGFSFGQVKIRHVVKDKLGNRNKITHYLKTHDGISITQIVNYYDDGRRYRVYTYENGMKHGKYIKWTRTAEKDNQEMVKQAYYLSEKGNYKHGKRSGGMKTFYRNGQLRWKGIYRRGIIAGPVNEFYPNGQLHRIILYMDGEKDGEYISYYEDGQLELEGEYFRGIRIGTWKFYGRNQEVVEEIIYKEGQPWEGTYTAWDSQKTPAPCTGDPMIFGFLYKNGNQSLIYRDENKKIFICTDDNTIHNIEQNI
tara:strand:- start:10102 stop:10914 length:813 start_codon:yes stop_codon:yes gene_type:complete